MRPAFTKALYYPYIDIRNSDWLKTAILFWDSVATIVPESIEHPYDTPDSEFLAGIGFLQPFHVSPTERSVLQIEDDVLSLMHTPDVLQALTMPRRSGSGHIYDSKMSYRVREQMLQLMRGGVYAEKMSHRIADELRHINRNFYENGMFHLDDGLANLYMTILANKICENESIALVTDDTTSQLLSNSARFDNQNPLIENRRYRRDKDLEQGLLLDLIVNGLRIAPDASLTEIVDFKERHKDELGLFESSPLREGSSTRQNNSAFTTFETN